MTQLTDALTTFQNATYWNSLTKLGKGYAVAYQAEAQAVAAWVRQLDANPAAVPPVCATKHGQGLVGMIQAATKLAAPTPAPAPTPTPAPTPGSTRHYGAIRLGSSFPTLQNPGSYGLACGTVADAARLVALDASKTRRCVYMSAVDCPSWFAGVDQGQAVQNGWTLGPEPGGYVLDLGNPNLQAAQVAQIDAFMRDHGFQPGDGFYFDDLVLDPSTLLTSKTLPSKYPTVKAWHDNALLPWVKTVPPALSAKGWYVGANALAWSPSNDLTTVYPGTDPNNGTMQQSYYRDICPHLDWVMLETGFFPNNSALRKEYASNPQWPAFWGGYRALIPLAESLGCDFYATVNAVNQAALVYTRATFEVSTTGRAGGVLCFPQDATDPSAAAGNWAKDLGQPTGSTVQSGDIYSRSFTNGTVTINPYAGTATIT